jgi:P4 family phage/plasmid primase-like protien
MAEEYRTEPENDRGDVDVRRAAERYMRAGLAVIPVPAGSKNPNRQGWQTERWTLEDIPEQWTNGQNIGVLTGEPSGWRIDVDLDVPEAVQLAGRFLAPTRTSGRASAPDSHWWYVGEGMRSVVFEDLAGEAILEVRSTGRQTVVAPSLHPSGERCRWSQSGLDEAHVEPDDLLRACRSLATAVLVARVLPKGGRHRFGLALAGFLLRRGLDPETVEKILHAAWDAAGFETAKAKREAHADIEGVVRDTAEGLAEGREVSGGRVLDELVPGLPRKLARFWGWSPREQENGRVQAQKITTNVLADAITAVDHFAQDAGGKLYRFSGGTYNRYAERYIRQRVKEVLESSGRADEWSSHRANEVVEYIRADAPELWERPPLGEVNVLNGILNVETRELREHDPGFLSPVQIPVRYDPEAACPEWDRFVAEVFPEDARELAFEMPADLMTPSRSAQKAILLLGEGSNGKSTYLRALSAFVGSPNISTVSLHKLESDRFSTARLVGKLANVCPDLPSTHLAATSIFKAVTGGDALLGEYKYRESFEFDPYCRLVFSANHVPRSGDASHAFFRRWLVIPFDRTFEPSEQVPREELDAKLADPRELSGVLNRALDVLPRVRREGFSETGSMRAAHEEFRAMTDPVAVWLAQNTVESAQAFVAKAALLQAYNRDCEEHGRAGMTATAFGLAMKRARPGISEGQRTVNGKPRVKVWLGIGLRGNGGDDGGGGEPQGPPGNPGNPVNPVPLIVSENGPEGEEEGKKPGVTSKENPVNPVTSVTHPPDERLTAVEDQRYRQLVREGMKPSIAREQIMRRRG